MHRSNDFLLELPPLKVNCTSDLTRHSDALLQFNCYLRPFRDEIPIQTIMGIEIDILLMISIGTLDNLTYSIIYDIKYSNILYIDYHVSHELI